MTEKATPTLIKCTKCKEEKQQTDFYKRKNRIMTRCKTCESNYAKNRRLKKLEQRKLNEVIPTKENEIWKDIKGYEGIYKISNFGNVYSCVRLGYGGILLKNTVGNKGYNRISLCRNGERRKLKRVHRLVAEAFLDNPNNYKCIDHKDRNKTNNSYTNLRYCSYSENCRNKYISGGIYIKKKGLSRYRVSYTPLHEKRIFKYFKTMEEAKESLKQIREKYKDERTVK